MAEARASTRLVWSCAAIGLGGILLGLQRQATGELVGTGLRPLGISALIAAVALIFTFLTGVRVPGISGSGSFEPRLPRDGLGAIASLGGFAGLTFLIAAVLLPGGSWMFVEALVIVLVLARSQTGPANLAITRGPSLRHGALVAFSQTKQTLPRAVRAQPKLLADFQAGLAAEGVELAWPEAHAVSGRTVRNVLDEQCFSLRDV